MSIYINVKSREKSLRLRPYSIRRRSWDAACSAVLRSSEPLSLCKFVYIIYIIIINDYYPNQY
jgi:hypothetical protein